MEFQNRAQRDMSCDEGISRAWKSHIDQLSGRKPVHELHSYRGCSPSSVARACDPSGGNSVVEHGSGSCGSGPVRLYSGPPVPSRELIHAGRTKAWAAWILKRRGPRQAGFTEQRRPPAPGSGRITGRRRSGPAWPNGPDPLNHHFFSF
ncbi:hypothetical protein NL676_011914 [Syzygium grande]|nr:hypothetical protein NL676_011914 [Syzygium grande]